MNDKKNVLFQSNTFSEQQQQIDYMFEKSLEILLSDFGKRKIYYIKKCIYLDSQYFTSPVLFIMKVFILHRFLILASYALDQIFPSLIRRMKVSSSKQYVNERRFPRGRINWRKTINIQAKQGLDWISYEAPMKQYESPENLLATVSLFEIICHSRSMHAYFSKILSEETFELNKLKDIEKKAEKYLFLTPLRDLLTEIQTRDLQFNKEYELFITKDLGPSRSSYQAFCRRSEEHILARRQINYYYRRLVYWRRQYAKNIDDFVLTPQEEQYSSEITLKWTINRLYEIFVLLLIANHIANENIDLRIKQSSFLRPREGSLFVLEKENFPLAWFHYDHLAKVETIQGMKLIVRSFPIRPDITFLNQNRITHSAIIDMKKHKKFTSDATSQMHRYKDTYCIEYNGLQKKIVKEAILCFSCEIQYDQLQEGSYNKYNENIIEIPIPDDFNLHCVSIYPSPDAEIQNYKGIDYISKILLGLLKA